MSHINKEKQSRYSVADEFSGDTNLIEDLYRLNHEMKIKLKSNIKMYTSSTRGFADPVFAHSKLTNNKFNFSAFIDKYYYISNSSTKDKNVNLRSDEQMVFQDIFSYQIESVSIRNIYYVCNLCETVPDEPDLLIYVFSCVENCY